MLVPALFPYQGEGLAQEARQVAREGPEESDGVTPDTAFKVGFLIGYGAAVLGVGLGIFVAWFCVRLKAKAHGGTWPL